MLTDQAAIAYLGFYYAEKISAAADLRMYNELEDERCREDSIVHLETALEYWNQYASAFSSQYLPQRFSRLFAHVDPVELIEDVERDISIAERWRFRPF